MSEVVSVNFKLDAETKKKMEEICSGLGLTLSAAFTIFAKAIVREQGIPFELSLKTCDPFYSPKNISYLEKKMQDYKSGKLILSEHDLARE